MKSITRFQTLFVGAACLVTVLSIGANANNLTAIQSGWATATYEVDAEHRADALREVLESARRSSEASPENAELLIWRGILASSLAGEQGGLGALGLAKEARRSLEAALALNPDALNGSAHTSLGTLYHRVPGWPIGFGSDKKAKQHLEQALEINPKGIDSNYFMAAFLFDEGDLIGARRFLAIAAAAADRPDRPVADAGRRQDIAKLLEAIDEDG